MKDWLIKTSLVAIALLSPVHPMLITAGILIFIDLVVGILAAKKRNEVISSAALRRTVSKILVYQLAIITGFICEMYLFSNLFPVSKLVAGVVGVVELTSILENLNTINGSPIFKNIIDKLGSESNKDQPK